jgi:flagellar L-ring protein precursor FlgH
MAMKRILPVITLVVLAGCGTAPHRDPAYAAAAPVAPAPASETGGAIWQPALGLALYEDIRARHVGDTLTIVLLEETNASKNAKTNTKKEEDVEMEAPVFLGSPITFNAPGFVPLASNRDNTLAANLNAKREFNGEGTSTQGNSLTGSVTVTVHEVLPNGNLVVRGEKLLTLNQGDETVRISGIVRPADIRPDNSVSSSQVADARIIYAGRGALADANRQGWLTRMLSSAWWPF